MCMALGLKSEGNYLRYLHIQRSMCTPDGSLPELLPSNWVSNFLSKFYQNLNSSSINITKKIRQMTCSIWHWWIGVCLLSLKSFKTFNNFMTKSFSSVAQSCPTLCDPMNHSTPGFPVHHQLLEFTQTHVHRVGDAIQPSHLLSSILFLLSICPSI